MATGFSTRSGPDGYRLNFDTDNLDYYLLMQKIARHCIDGKPAADVAEIAGAVKKVGAERAAELVEADREGRVKILPKSEENTCGSCGHFQRAPGLNSGTCDVQSRYKNKWGQEDVKRGLFTPYQSRRACKKYVGKGVDQHEQNL